MDVARTNKITIILISQYGCRVCQALQARSVTKLLSSFDYLNFVITFIEEDTNISERDQLTERKMEEQHDYPVRERTENVTPRHWFTIHLIAIVCCCLFKYVLVENQRPSQVKFMNNWNSFKSLRRIQSKRFPPLRQEEARWNEHFHCIVEFQ